MPVGRSRRALFTTPPPQALYRGSDALSRTTTPTPDVARERAADAPAGPLPMTITSHKPPINEWLMIRFALVKNPLDCESSFVPCLAQGFIHAHYPK